MQLFFGWLAWLLTVLGGYLAVLGAVLCLSCGLYYAAELAEEYSVLTGKLLKYATQGVVAGHLLLWLDGFPFGRCLTGTICHGAYAWLLNDYPRLELSSPAFILAILAFLLSHYSWFTFLASGEGPFLPFVNSLGFFAVFSSCVFYVVFIAGPWGFWYTNLPRPKCEKSVENDPSSLNTGIAPEHGVPQVGWKGTKGGWKSDYDATWYDIAAIVSQLFVLLLLPLTTTEACRKWNSSLSGGGDERAVKAAISDQAQIVSNTAKYRMHQRVFVVVMGVAVLGILVGQAISGARFGMAWAEGVVQQEWDADGTGWLFDEVALAEAVYDQTVATLALTVACGLVFATALQRHLINGVGCYSAALFFAWVALVCVFALPLTIYAAQRSIFNEKAASKDCVHFPRTSHEFENDLCVSRFWTLLIGGIIFVGTLLLITGMGAAEAIPALLKTRKRAAVFLKENAPPSQVFRASTPGMAMQSGYRSESEPFFNYAAKPTEPSDSLLYAPQMKLSIPRR